VFIASGVCGSERSSLVKRIFTRRAKLQFAILWLAAGTLTTFVPSVCQAELIFSDESQISSSDEFGITSWQDFSSSDPPQESGGDENQEIPEEQAAPYVESDMDATPGGATTIPVHPTGGGSSMAGLPTVALRFSLSAASRRISVIEAIAPDPPPPCELLDPPKDVVV
jgi:hypothetical protein